MKKKQITSIILTLLICVSLIFTAGAQINDATERTGLYDIISDSIGSCTGFLKESLSEETAKYGYEWYFITLLRGGKDIPEEIKECYLSSVTDTVKSWSETTKATDISRVVIALKAMGENPQNIDGVDLLKLLYNNETVLESSNALSYTLIALDVSGAIIPENAIWSREKILEKLLTYQLDDGGFGLFDTEKPDTDITAICLQALTPYKDTCPEEFEKGMDYLKSIISEDFTYSDNPNTLAQVIILLSGLRIDVTAPENGFGDESLNVITALNEYKSSESNGFLYDGSVNAMTTVQAFQAFDSYRKAHKENISYWDFSNIGEIYNDEIPFLEIPEEETPKAEDALIYVNIITEGGLAENMAMAPITVCDLDEDGILTVDEALFAAHEAYFSGGAEAGYATYMSAYGLSIATLWGKGTADAPAAVGYYINHKSCLSPLDEVKNGDILTAFNYYDTTYYSDAYSYFNESKVSVAQGNSITLTLNYQSGYDENWNSVFSPCPDAKVFILGSNNQFKAKVTNNSGKVTLSFPKGISEGDYYAVAYKDDFSIVPAVAKITVTKKNNSSSSASKDIKVSIKVADPKGKVYLSKKTYTVEKGISPYDLLMKTGLSVEAETSAYGVYVKGIEGLNEFDKGNESGWMFRVNGKFPDCSIVSYSLKNKDYVEILYTQDGGNDIGKSYIKSSSGGSGKSNEKTQINSEIITKVKELSKATNEFLLNTVKEPISGQVGGEWTILSLARGSLDVKKEYYKKYTDSLLKKLDENEGILHSKKYTEYSRAVIALSALGINPADFYGYNLLLPLADFEKVTFQGINGSVFALLALDTKGYTIPVNPEAKIQATREMYIENILSLRKSDGGWALSGDTSDPDITGMALQALSKYQDNEKVKEATQTALLLMSEKQNKDGSFSSYDKDNIESSVQMLIALCELKTGINDPRFIKNENTLFDSLQQYLINNNSFKHIKSDNDYDLMATEQAAYALASLERFISDKNGLYNMEDSLSLKLEDKEFKKEECKSSFTDIDLSKYKKEIESLFEMEIIKGKNELSFDPEGCMTRAEFSTLMVKALALPITNKKCIFKDVSEDKWFYDYITSLYETGIIKGVSDNSFNPDGKITKEEASAMIERAYIYSGKSALLTDYEIRSYLSQFPDYVKTSDWALNSLAFCFKYEILDDDEIYINPKAYVKREEIAFMVYNLLKIK